MSQIKDNFKGSNWVITGLFFGVMLYVSSEIIIPLIKDGEIDDSNLLTGAFVAVIVGLVFGYFMKYVVSVTRTK